MKTTININGKPVEIELTAEQVAQIKKASTDYRDIKTFDDACEFVGIDPDEFEEENGHLPPDVYAFMQLRIIALALNGGVKLRYAIDKMWEPWFNISRAAHCGAPVGPGHVYTANSRSYTSTYIGSRICYKSREIAEYAGDQFVDIYNQLLTGGEDSE